MLNNTHTIHPFIYIINKTFFVSMILGRTHGLFVQKDSAELSAARAETGGRLGETSLPVGAGRAMESEHPREPYEVSGSENKL